MRNKKLEKKKREKKWANERRYFFRVGGEGEGGRERLVALREGMVTRRWGERGSEKERGVTRGEAGGVEVYSVQQSFWCSFVSYFCWEAQTKARECKIVEGGGEGRKGGMGWRDTMGVNCNVEEVSIRVSYCWEVCQGRGGLPYLYFPKMFVLCRLEGDNNADLYWTE